MEWDEVKEGPWLDTWMDATAKSTSVHSVKHCHCASCIDLSYMNKHATLQLNTVLHLEQY